jgi:hypothetical protein
MITVFLLVVGAILYGLPTAVALANHHRYAVSIAVLNLCGGWTVLG